MTYGLKKLGLGFSDCRQYRMKLNQINKLKKILSAIQHDSDLVYFSDNI